MTATAIYPTCLILALHSTEPFIREELIMNITMNPDFGRIDTWVDRADLELVWSSDCPNATDGRHYGPPPESGLKCWSCIVRRIENLVAANPGF